MTIRFSTQDTRIAGKLADVELHFGDGPLAGLKLTGFSVWERRGWNGYNVTMPARQYTVNGDKRSFALLRPITDVAAHDDLRQRIVEAFLRFQMESANTEQS